MSKNHKNFLEHIEFSGKVDVFKDYAFHENHTFITKDYIQQFFNKSSINLEIDNYIHQMRQALNNELDKVDFEEMEFENYEAKVLNNAIGANIYINTNSSAIKSYDINKEGKSLFTELAKISPENMHDILKFVKIWGLPEGLISNFGEKFNFQSDDVNIWASATMNIVKKILAYENIFDIFKSIVMDELDSRNYKYAFSQLIDSLNGEFHLELSLVNDYEENLRPKTKFRNLFDIAYFQIINAIVLKSKFRRCKYCGHIFQIYNVGMQFCPPLPFRNRSSCEMAYNNRMKRAWKLHNEGKTIEEIDKQVDLPIEEINAYIQRRDGDK